MREHAGVHAAIGERFAKPGRLDPRLHRWMIDAFAKRLQADYGFDAVLAHEDVDEMIAQAGQFLKAVRALLDLNRPAGPIAP